MLKIIYFSVLTFVPRFSFFYFFYICSLTEWKFKVVLFNLATFIVNFCSCSKTNGNADDFFPNIATLMVYSNTFLFDLIFQTSWIPQIVIFRFLLCADQKMKASVKVGYVLLF